MSFIGPTPLYNNPPIQPQFYQPKKFTISNVTLGTFTTVETTEDMDYVVGQLVRLIIPATFGCRQLNETQSYVIDIPSSNEVVLDLNSSENVDSYISSPASTKAQILPIGDINTGQINASGRSNTGTYIPGSFINISPQ